MSDAPRCSFCGREKGTEVKVLIESTKNAGVRICERCVKWADSDEATIVHCQSCTPVDGRHHPNCPERLIA